MSGLLSFSRLSSITAKHSAFSLIFRSRIYECQRKQVAVSFCAIRVRFFSSVRSYSEVFRYEVDNHGPIPPSFQIKNKTSSCSVVPPGPLPLHTVSRLIQGQVRSQGANDNEDMCSCQHSRTIVMCFDGTDEQFDLDNSNVVDFFSALHKGDHERQMTYYQSGFGTFTIPKVATPLYKEMKKVLDLLFARSINHHVMSGYKFLMDNCKHTWPGVTVLNSS